MSISMSMRGKRTDWGIFESVMVVRSGNHISFLFGSPAKLPYSTGVAGMVIYIADPIV